MKVFMGYFNLQSRPIYSNKLTRQFYSTGNNGATWNKLNNDAMYFRLFWDFDNKRNRRVYLGKLPKLKANYNWNANNRAVATRFQALWRGYKARQSIRHPNPNNAKAEQKILFMEKRNRKSTRRYNARKHRSLSGLENVRRLFN